MTNEILQHTASTRAGDTPPAGRHRDGHEWQGRKDRDMKSTHKDYGITATITDKADGTARLIARNQHGKKVRDKVYNSRKGALAAWRRMCD